MTSAIMIRITNKSTIKIMMKSMITIGIMRVKDEEKPTA